MDNKAQGALEYLLLIGGAVLVAVVVIALISSMAQNNTINGAVDTAQTNIADQIEDNLPA